MTLPQSNVLDPGIHLPGYGHRSGETALESDSISRFSILTSFRPAMMLEVSVELHWGQGVMY